MAEWDKGMSLKTPPVHVAAGPQRMSAAFIRRYAGPVDDLLAPPEITDADPRIGIGYGVTALPHLRELTVTGPARVTGLSDTPSRRKIFTCRPAESEPSASSGPAAKDETCATDIVRRLASHAYREPVGAADLADLMRLYNQERAKTGFESGIRLALQAILSNPRFLIRIERTPSTPLTPGADLSHQRRRSRVATVVLSVGNPAGRGAVAGGGAIDAAQRRRTRAAGAASARRSTIGSARDAVREAVAAAAGRRQGRRRIRCFFRSSITSSASRTSVRPSCSSIASCATIAACSSC